MIIPSFQAELNDVMLSCFSLPLSLSPLFPLFPLEFFLSGNIWFIQWYNHFSSFALFHFRRGTKQELNKATTADALRLFVVVASPSAPSPSAPLLCFLLSFSDSSKNDKWKQDRKKKTNPFVNRLQCTLRLARLSFRVSGTAMGLG